MSTVLVYADRPDIRERVRLAIGPRPDPELGPLEFLDVADGPALIDAVDHRDADICVLDAEATPTGGMGLSRQIKNEIPNCPPTVLLVARRDDRWLGSWSQADAVVTHPVDPAELAEVVVALLRARRSLAARPGSSPAAGTPVAGA
ncbi:MULTISPECIES: hypothetical protein [unclassified Frankia]|uniref:hypothetical protein n=1 Tax=unclassified Frankia TaxID=2632575 RepID=UPI001EF60E92|nr:MULTISPECIES: hypothetical protein [unclassified Frankia]